jgi:hypothetical protein
MIRARPTVGRARDSATLPGVAQSVSPSASSIRIRAASSG